MPLFRKKTEQDYNNDLGEYAPLPKKKESDPFVKPIERKGDKTIVFDFKTHYAYATDKQYADREFPQTRAPTQDEIAQSLKRKQRFYSTGGS